MPPFSKNLAEEGVLIRNFKLVDAGQSRLDELRELLLVRSVSHARASTTTWPTSRPRSPPTTKGRAICGGWSSGTRCRSSQAYMRHIQDAAERKMRPALARLPDGAHEFVDHLDDGTPIAVAITIAGDAATIDFTGTGPVLAGNLNANRAIVTAAVMYVLRLLIDEDIPLNQGVLAPVEIDPARVPARIRRERATPARCAGGRRRQRRDVAARGRCAAGALGAGGGQPGDDEQPALRRRARSATTKRSAAAAARRRTPTAPTPSTRT